MGGWGVQLVWKHIKGYRAIDYYRSGSTALPKTTYGEAISSEYFTTGSDQYFLAFKQPAIYQSFVTAYYFLTNQTRSIGKLRN